jgi:DNA-binding CsgD family transcriptional regulator
MSRVEMILPKVGSVAEAFLKQPNTNKKLGRRGDQISANKSIEKLLSKINSVKSYDEIPTSVIFSYNNLINRNIDFKDTLDLVNLTVKLAANKFNQKPKEIVFTGYTTSVIDIDNHEKLVSAGFLGCLASPKYYGIEMANEVDYRHTKDPTYWSPVIVPDKKIQVLKPSPIGIQLTFRQEQILKMVCEKGMTNYQIAKRLDIGESTVKMHIGIVFKKYGVRDRSQLIFSLKEKIG